jgi:hypothetical protein
MRLRGLMVLAAASLGLSGCVNSLRSQPPPKWTIGFWYWHGSSAEAALAKEMPDALFFHAGTISKYEGRNVAERWSVSREYLSDSLPAAREYWLVFRKEEAGVPDVSAAPVLADRVFQLLGDARQRRLKVVGIQLDIDSPTSRLSAYGEFLRAVRKEIPAGIQISITALLDWFRDGTSIADVIKQTDEFVPQFYDAAAAGSSNDYRAIAVKIDAARWAPKFNRFGKRYRIGISTFGRARFVPKADPSQAGYSGLRLFGDLTPIDIAGNPAFDLQTSHTEANELVLSYRPMRKVQIGYNDLQPGEMVQFILSTPEAIRAAVESARRMGGNCAGVVFFRWPQSDENLVMQPDEVSMAARLTPREQKVVGVEPVDGHCAAVSCVDLYLVNASALSSKAARYRIRSSGELEYFLPQDRVPVRMAGPSDLELTLPAYAGTRRILLGRAVSATRAEFRVEEEQ